MCHNCSRAFWACPTAFSMSSNPEHDSSSSGQMSSENSSEGVDQYFERYLKNMHPDWSTEELKTYLERWLADEFCVSMIQGMMEVDQKIREQLPHLQWQSMADFPQWLTEWNKYVMGLIKQTSRSSDNN